MDRLKVESLEPLPTPSLPPQIIIFFVFAELVVIEMGWFDDEINSLSRIPLLETYDAL